MVGQVDNIPHGPTQDGVSLYIYIEKLPRPPITNFHQLSNMVKKRRSGAAPSTPNTAQNAIIFRHGVARDVRRAGKAMLYAVLARLTKIGHVKTNP